MARYSDDFLAALGTWQRGWNEEKERRLEVTARLRQAIEDARSDLPAEAFLVPSLCFRKRILVPHNNQNGGDFVPLVRDCGINEGVASWTTDFDFARSFRKFELGPPPTIVAVIFGWEPKPEDLIVNIAGLWKLEGFRKAVQDFGDRKGENAGALLYYRDTQSEVVLDAPLKLSEVRAFCGSIPSFAHVCKVLGISEEEQEDQLWTLLDKADLIRFGEFWVEEEEALEAVLRMLDNIKPMLEKAGVLAPEIGN